MNTILEFITFRRTIASTVIVALFWVWAIIGLFLFAAGIVGVVTGTISLLRFAPFQPESRLTIILLSLFQIFGMAAGLMINMMVARITCELLVQVFRFFDNVKSITDSQYLLASIGQAQQNNTTSYSQGP